MALPNRTLLSITPKNMRPCKYGQNQAEQQSGQKTHPECLIPGQAFPLRGSQIRLTMFAASCSDQNRLKTERTFL